MQSSQDLPPMSEKPCTNDMSMKLSNFVEPLQYDGEQMQGLGTMNGHSDANSSLYHCAYCRNSQPSIGD